MDLNQMSLERQRRNQAKREQEEIPLSFIVVLLFAWVGLCAIVGGIGWMVWRILF